jgi:hypothetical protein
MPGRESVLRQTHPDACYQIPERMQENPSDFGDKTDRSRKQQALRANTLFSEMVNLSGFLIF